MTGYKEICIGDVVRHKTIADQVMVVTNIKKDRDKRTMCYCYYYNLITGEWQSTYFFDFELDVLK